MALQVDEKRAKLAPTGEIIDAELDDLSGWLRWQRHDAPKKRVPRGLDAHAIRDTHPQSASSCQPNALEQLKEPRRHPRSGSN
jgi:hypothetical protein